MKSLFAYKGSELRAYNKCPLCGGFRTEAYFPAAHFENAQESAGYLPPSDAKASVQFFCGFELAINDHDEIVSARYCSEVGREKASEINELVEEAYENEREELER